MGRILRGSAEKGKNAAGLPLTPDQMSNECLLFAPANYPYRPNAVEQDFLRERPVSFGT
jgi:hypothetical protein